MDIYFYVITMVCFMCMMTVIGPTLISSPTQSVESSSQGLNTLTSSQIGLVF